MAVLGTGCATTPVSPADVAADTAHRRADPRSEVLVMLRPLPPPLLDRTSLELAELHGLEPRFGWPLASIDLHCVVFAVPDDRTTDEVVQRLERDHRVEWAQPSHVFHTLADDGDPHLQLQTGLRAIRAQRAHRWSTGRGVRVAVVDNGVDLAHPDLRGRVVRASQLVDRSRFTGDLHGTAVAGVIAAVAGNRVGIVGVSPGADLLALKACREDGAAGVPSCTTYSLARALDLGILERARVINLSLTGPDDLLLARLIDAAIERRITVVAARDTGAADGFPASRPGVLAASIGDPANASGRLGEPAVSGLAAPGIDILTTVPGGSYDFLSGSSFAAAHVSGVAALLLERDPDLSPQQIATLLLETAQVPATSGGVRMIDACAAVARLVGEAASSCG